MVKTSHSLWHMMSLNHAVCEDPVDPWQPTTSRQPLVTSQPHFLQVDDPKISWKVSPNQRPQEIGGYFDRVFPKTESSCLLCSTFLVLEKTCLWFCQKQSFTPDSGFIGHFSFKGLFFNDRTHLSSSGRTMRLTVWKRELLQLQLCSASLMECLRLTEQDPAVFFCNDGAGWSKRCFVAWVLV